MPANEQTHEVQHCVDTTPPVLTDLNPEARGRNSEQRRWLCFRRGEIPKSKNISIGGEGQGIGAGV